MAFVPFVETDQPTMAAFNEKFQQAIGDAVAQSAKSVTGSWKGTYTGSSGEINHTIHLQNDWAILFITTSPGKMFYVFDRRGQYAFSINSPASQSPSLSNQNNNVVEWGTDHLIVNGSINYSTATYFYFAIS